MHGSPLHDPILIGTIRHTNIFQCWLVTVSCTGRSVGRWGLQTNSGPISRIWKPLAERIAAESIVNVKQVRDFEGCNGVNFTHQSSAGKKVLEKYLVKAENFIILAPFFFLRMAQ